MHNAQFSPEGDLRPRPCASGKVAHDVPAMPAPRGRAAPPKHGGTPCATLGCRQRTSLLQKPVFAKGVFGDACGGFPEEAGDVFAEDVTFEVERVTGLAVAEAGGVEGVGDEVDL